MPHKQLQKQKEKSKYQTSEKLKNNNLISQDAPLMEHLTQKKTKINKKDEKVFSAAHNEVVSALQQGELSEKNKFSIQSDQGYNAVLLQYQKEKELINKTIENLDKAKNEFLQGTGGTEFTNLKTALQKFNLESTPINTEAVQTAAFVYVQTHKKIFHGSRQGSRRYKYAQMLAEDIINLEYLRERQQDMEEELTYAQEDAQENYLKGDQIRGKSTNVEGLNSKDQDALNFYSQNENIITLIDDEIEIKPAGNYTSYKFVNSVRRGIITKEELNKLSKQLENVSEETRDRIQSLLDLNEQMDHAFEHSPGLGSTSIVYRGISASQMKSMLNLKDLSDLNKIADRLESLVGKLVYDGGFVSTSRSKAEAARFAINDNRDIGMMMEIVARKGSEMIDITDISATKEEEEQLVKDGSKMFIRGFRIERMNGKPVIVLKAELRKSDNK